MWHHASFRRVYSYDGISLFNFFENGSVCRVYVRWKTPPRNCMWCYVCLLTSHKTEYLLTHFREGTPLRYFKGFWPCCNGSRLHLSRRWWSHLRHLHLRGERGWWIYAPCFDCRGGSSVGSGVWHRYSCGERLGESTRLAWAWSRCCRICCQTRSCILSLRWSRPLCGWCAYLICLLWRGWFPAQCCPGCFSFTLIFLVSPTWMGTIRCSGGVGHTCSR